MVVDPVKRLADAVVGRRHQMGVTQAHFAKRGGPSTETLRLIENGLRKSYGSRTLAQLENVLQWKPGTAAKILDGTAGDDPQEWVEPDRDAWGEPLRVTMWKIIDGEERTFEAPLGAVPTHERAGWQRLERRPPIDTTTFHYKGEVPVEIGPPGAENDNVVVEPGERVTVIGLVTEETDDAYMVTKNDLGLREWPKDRWDRVASHTADGRKTAWGRGTAAIALTATGRGSAGATTGPKTYKVGQAVEDAEARPVSGRQDDATVIHGAGSVTAPPARVRGSGSVVPSRADAVVGDLTLAAWLVERLEARADNLTDEEKALHAAARAALSVLPSRPPRRDGSA